MAKRHHDDEEEENKKNENDLAVGLKMRIYDVVDDTLLRTPEGYIFDKNETEVLMVGQHTTKQQITQATLRMMLMCLRDIVCITTKTEGTRYALVVALHEDNRITMRDLATMELTEDVAVDDIASLISGDILYEVTEEAKEQCRAEGA